MSAAEDRMHSLDVNVIRTDGGTQMREAISEVTVERYAEHIEDGAEFPPVVVFYDGSDYWLADGFHRVHGYRAAGVARIPADIRSGQRVDAVRYALSANATNGKPRTSGDMRRAYDVAVSNGLCDAADVAAVKALLGCSERWARRLTEQARAVEKASRNAEIQRLHSQGLSQREIAEEAGVNQGTVSRLISDAERNCSEMHHPALPDVQAVPLDDEEDDSVLHFRARGTGENEWYTPPDILDLARSMLGAIDLDPASSEAAQEHVKAVQFFTREDDALSREWHGRVWLNPPYSQPDIRHFTEKMVEEYRAGRVREAIMLTHNYTDTAWFHCAEAEAAAICFTRGRIRFVSADGELAAPTQGQAFFYYGNRPDAFRVVFGGVGFVR